MNISAFINAKTLTQLTRTIQDDIDNLNVHLVGDGCRHVVLISKDDTYYINISVDLLNSHSNSVNIYDRVLGKDFRNKAQIRGNGFKTFTDFAFSLKRMAWAA
jgi:hypothetical protein